MNLELRQRSRRSNLSSVKFVTQKKESDIILYGVVFLCKKFVTIFLYTRKRKEEK